MAHEVTHLGTVLYDHHQWLDLLGAEDDAGHQSLLATLLEGDEEGSAPRKQSSGVSQSDDGAVAAAAPSGRGGGAAGAGSGSKKRCRKQQTGISAAQVNALEKEYLAKLELFKKLSAAQQALKDKAWVLDAVLMAHEELAVRLQHLQAWEAAQQKGEPPPADFVDPFQLLGLSLQDVRSTNPQGALDMLKSVQQSLARELLKYEMSGADDSQRVVHPELQRLGDGMIQASKYAGITRSDLILYNSLHVDSVLADDGSFAQTAHAMPQAPHDHWRKVAEAGKLSSQSLVRCHVLATLAEGWLDRIQAERRVLSAALGQTVATAGTQRYDHGSSSMDAPGGGASKANGAGSTSVGASSRSAQQQRQLMAQVQALATQGSAKSGEAAVALLLGMPVAEPGGVVGLPQDLPPEETIVARLQSNLDKERNIVLLVGELLWTRIFSVVESARIFVHSHPWICDDLCILRELSKLCVEREQAAQAGAAAARP